MGKGICHISLCSEQLAGEELQGGNSNALDTPRVRVGYEMVDNLLISNKPEWNSSFIKNAHKISRIFPDFVCKSNRFFSSFLITVTIWYNGSYTLMAKPVRAPESHYPIILSLVSVIPFWSCSGIHRAGVCQLINWIWQIDYGRTQQPFCFYPTGIHLRNKRVITRQK